MGAGLGAQAKEAFIGIAVPTGGNIRLSHAGTVTLEWPRVTCAGGSAGHGKGSWLPLWRWHRQEPGQLQLQHIHGTIQLP